MARLPARLLVRLRQRPVAGLVLAGALMGTAWAPIHFLPGLLGLAVLTVLLREARGFRHALARAVLFLWPMALVSLYWVGIAFFADAERFGLLAVPGVLGLTALVALVTALPLAAAAAMAVRSGWSFALLLAAAWLLAELGRGDLVFGFPWNPVAAVWTLSTASLQATAVIGSHGLSFLTVLAGCVLGVVWRREVGIRPGLGLGLALLLAVPGLGLWQLGRGEAEDGPGTTLRIVQGNIAQHHKWDPELRQRWFERHLQLSGAAGEADLVIWPESSIPYRLEQHAGVRAAVAERAGRDGYVLAGSDYADFDSEPPVLHNSVYVIDGEAAIRARYDKVDLVPFGEYMPLRWLFGRLGLEALAVGSIDFQPGEERRTLALPGLPPVSPLICYEAVFPLRATDGSGEARWLLNLTNDAWFGTSSGPYQHLAMARMRAAETGLPLVRAANTGISVVTDARGRVLERLPLNTMGTIEAALPGALTMPPPVARHPWLALLLPLLGLLMAAFFEFKAKTLEKYSRIG